MGERRYGWSGGIIKENPDHCAEEVWDTAVSIGRQCLCPRGHGKDGLYCRQHAKRHPVTIGRMDVARRQPALQLDEFPEAGR